MDEQSPRGKACYKQCRIVRYLDGKPIDDGNCPCERPMECRFPKLADLAFDEDVDLMFPDVKQFIKEFWSE